jgi:hypothetical protein
MSEVALEIMVFAGSAPGIRIMNSAPAFCNRPAAAGLIPAVLSLVTPSAGSRVK